MRKKNLLIGVILLLIEIGILLFFKGYNSYQNNVEKKIIINKEYSKPIITTVNIKNNSLEIIANAYHYGDINQDNVIDNYDLDSIYLILTNNFTYTPNELKLADINQNGLIDKSDYELLKEFISNNPKTLYANKPLNYCVLESNNVNDCLWQDVNLFEYSDGKEYFYVQNGSFISDVYTYIENNIER